MNSALAARKLADFIRQLNFHQDTYTNSEPYSHIGALYTNIVLQSGLNYRTVVQPRVARMLIHYPKAATISGFSDLIEKEGIENIIKWKHSEKINRMKALLDFSKENSINSCADLSEFFKTRSNQEDFLQIKGFGNKTLDYTLKLLNFDTVAVDRHIYSFIELAGLQVIDYHTTKKVVEFAADLLQTSRSSIDYSIWNYMSAKSKDESNNQLSIDF